MSNHEFDGNELDGQTEVINSAETDRSDGAVMPGPVGYRRPPKHTQFAKGRSGNPKWAAKGRKNFGLVIEEELNAKIPIYKNGNANRSPSARRSPNSWSTRPRQAMRRLSQFVERSPCSGKSWHRSRTDPSHRVEDQQVMSGILDRIRRDLGGSIPPVPQPTASNLPAEQPLAGDTAEPPKVNRSHEESLPIWAINLRRPWKDSECCCR